MKTFMLIAMKTMKMVKTKGQDENANADRVMTPTIALTIAMTTTTTTTVTTVATMTTKGAITTRMGTHMTMMARKPMKTIKR